MVQRVPATLFRAITLELMLPAHWIWGNSVAGVRLDAPNNTVGGTNVAARNVISGNSSGITLGSASSTGNLIQGNYIGTDASATAEIGNTYGIWVTNGTANIIGGTAPGAANVISGNNQNGVYLTGASVTQNSVQGNYIGTNAGGQNLGNGSAGIRCDPAPQTIRWAVPKRERATRSPSAAVMGFGSTPMAVGKCDPRELHPFKYGYG